jgi:hypothetical protein
MKKLILVMVMVMVIGTILQAATYYVNGTEVASGTATAGDATHITLAAGSSTEDDYYNGYGIQLISGSGSAAANNREITDYDGATLIATVSSAWTTTNADNTTGYLITVGSDGTGNDGSTVDKGKAYMTLQNAIANIASGHTISVTAGTYREKTYNRIYCYNSVIGNKTLTFVAYDSENKPLISTNGTNGCLEVATDVLANQCVLNFTNFNFTSTTASVNYLFLVQGAGALNFTTCEFTPAAVGKNLFAISDTTNIMPDYYADRDLTLTNCTFAACYDFIFAKNSGTITIDGGTFGTLGRHFLTLDAKNAGYNIQNTSITGTANTSYLFTSNITTLYQDIAIVKSNTFTNFAGGIYAQPTCSLIDVEDNTVIINKTSATAGVGIQLGTNDVLDWVEGTTYAVGNTAKIDGMSFQCTVIPAGGAGTSQPLYSTDWTTYWMRCGLGKYLVANNIVRNVGSVKGHGYLIGSNMDAVHMYDNKSLEIDTVNPSYGFVIKGTNFNIHNNIAYGGNTFYISGGMYGQLHHNTGYCTSGAAFVWSNNNNGDGKTQSPTGNVVSNNIFAFVGDTGYVLTDTASNNDYDIRMDYNCYWNVGGAFATYNSEIKTFATWKTMWTTESVYFLLNDEHSINIDPQFVDVANNNYKTKTNLWLDYDSDGIVDDYIGASPSMISRGWIGQ